ncbi:MAG: AraC family transcriptional regulator, partial [Thioalkalivibrio sp.]|nr:AraC family transcriptional regulator [Thioalkalivibrio sp.]
FVDSMMSALVVRLARLADQSIEAAEHRGGLAPRCSAKVIEYMQVHLDRHIKLAELAALCGLSPWHFSHAFRETHGYPPHRYLTRLRIQRARELLERTPMSITEIAMAIGYSPQQLVRHFRQATGLPPREYRRRLHL